MKFYAIFLASILIAGLVGLSNFDDAFAEMEKIDVKLFFVTSFDECSRNNWEALEGYDSITKDYLWKYNIVANTSIDCINEDRVKFAVDSSLSSHDLVIIFPDFWKSLEWLYLKGIGGHYMYPGTDKTIVTQALTFNFDSEESIWILSHELSHFTLHWYGYPYSVRVDEVHTRQAEYDACMDRDPTGAYCRHLWELVESVVTADESRGIGKKYRVMEPLRSERSPCTIFSCYNGKIVGYVGQDGFTVNGIKTSSSSFKEGDQICVNYKLGYVSKDFQKKYPIPFEKIKVGKTVLDKNGNAITYPEYKYYTANNLGNVEFCEKFKMFSSSHTLNGYKYQAYFEGSSKYGESTAPLLTKYFSKSTIVQTPITPQPTPTPSIQNDDRKIGFSNLRVVDSFGNSITNPTVGEKIYITADLYNLQNLEQPFAYLIEVQDTTGVTVSLAWISGSLSAEQSFSPALTWAAKTAGTYNVKALVWKSADNPTSLALPIEKRIYVQSNEPEPITDPTPKPITTKIDFDGDGIPDYKDTCPTQSEDYNNYIDWDGCPDKKQLLQLKDSDGDGINDWNDLCRGSLETYNGYKDTDGCPDEKPQTSVTSQQTKPQPTCGSGTVLKNGLCIVEEKSDPYRQKAIDAKSIYEKKIGTLFSPINDVSADLYGLKFDNSDAQKKIDEVWQVREMAEAKFNQIKRTAEQGYQSYNNGDFKQSYESFKETESIEDSMNEDLSWISKAIEDAKKLENSICFLNWCFVNPFSNW